jgi:hypothetical protein
MRVRQKRVVEHDLVEIMAAGQVDNRADRDSRNFHLDQELGQPVAAVFLGRWRGPQQRDHVIGFVRVAGPDLAPVDEPPAVGFCRSGRGGEHVRPRVRLREPDAEAQLAGGDARQDLLADFFLAITQDDGARLPVGG